MPSGVLKQWDGSSWEPVVVGKQGPTGPTGPQGQSVTGPTGPQGNSITGPTGPPGASVTGPTGWTGPAAVASGAASDMIALADVQWLYLTSATSAGTPTIFDQGNGTLTAASNYPLSDIVDTSISIYTGLGMTLVVDRLNGMSGPAAVGDRVLWVDYYNGMGSGVYTVTDLGSASTPWVLTQAPDLDTNAEFALDYQVALSGTPFFARSARVYPSATASTFNYEWTVGSLGGLSAGPYTSTRNSEGAVALGEGATTTNRYGVALGYYPVSSGVAAVAVGRDASAQGNESIAVGSSSVSSGYQSVAVGPYSAADGFGSTAVGYGADTHGVGNATVLGQHTITRDRSVQTSVGAVGFSSMGTIFVGGDAVLPDDASVNIPVGQRFVVYQQGTTPVTVTAPVGVTLDGPNVITVSGVTTVTAYGNGSVLMVEKVGADWWLAWSSPARGQLPKSSGAGDLMTATAVSDENTWVSRASLAADSAFTGAFAPKTATVGSSLGTSGTIDLNMSTLNGTYQTITLTGNPTFTTSNRAAGRWVTVKLAAGGSSRALAFPSWVFVGAAAPTTLASGKTAVFTVTMFDANDTGAVAAYAAQP